MHRILLLTVVPVSFVACSSAKVSPPDSTLPATACVTTPVPEGRLVHITLDDLQDGFGSFGSRADGDLAPGIIRLELEADEHNDGPAAVQVMLGDVEVAMIRGVAAGDTCGIDLEVGVGTYRVVDGERDVEFEIVAPS